MMSDVKNISEKELILLLKNKDRLGINYLYDSYSAALYGVILRIVNDEKETAEDLLQETFIRIWDNFSSYDAAKGRLFTWMMNIARNLAIDKLRSKDHRQAGQIQSIDKSVHTINKVRSVSNNTDHIGMKALVEKLKPEYWEVINLLYYKGYTQTEAAEELQMPLGTVKTRTRAALIELKKIMGA